MPRPQSRRTMTVWCHLSNPAIGYAVGGLALAGVVVAVGYTVEKVAKAKNPVTSAADSIASIPGIGEFLPGLGQGVSSVGTGVGGLGVGVGAATSTLASGLTQGIGNVSSLWTVPGNIVSGIGDWFSGIQTGNQSRKSDAQEFEQQQKALRAQSIDTCWKNNRSKSWPWKLFNCGVA